MEKFPIHFWLVYIKVCQKEFFKICSSKSKTIKPLSPLPLLVLKSSFVICMAYTSQSFLLKLNTMTGAKFRSIIILTTLKISVWLASLFLNPPLLPFSSPLAASPVLWSTAIAALKLSSLKVP
jgi:hypothetical protein